MNQINSQTLNDIIKLIVDTANPEKIILFGSQSKRNTHPHSDIDILIIESEPFTKGRSRRKEMGKLERLLAKWGIPTDVLIYSHEEVEYWRDSINHVLARALRDGKLLYERH